jgi:hypothetical protein
VILFSACNEKVNFEIKLNYSEIGPT